MTDIGKSYMYINGPVRIYGTVLMEKGIPYNGVYPILVLETPHGSKIESGRVWCRPIESVDDTYMLVGYDIAAASKDVLGAIKNRALLQ